MVTTNEYKNDQKSYKMMNISIILFVVVLVITVWMYFYNGSIISKINTIQGDITRITTEIKKVNEDEKIKLYTLITANSLYLQKYKDLSQIPVFINNVSDLSRKYRVLFSWFSYSQGQIVSNAKTQNDAVSLASTKTKNFLEYFRKKDDNIFWLLPVTSFSGQETIEFSIKFEVKK